MRASLLSVLLLLVNSLAFASADVENKWRLQFSGDADSAGQLVLAIAPKGQPAVAVTVPIAAGTSENEVASAVVNALRLKLGDSYRVERDDGEDVLVKRRVGEPKFSIALVENTVRGVRLNLDEE